MACYLFPFLLKMVIKLKILQALGTPLKTSNNFQSKVYSFLYEDKNGSKNIN